MVIKKTESYALITISVLIFLSFIIGFIFNENSAGAGGYNGDFGNYIWPNLNLLKENIFENLTSLKYTDSRTPIPYVFHILLNPFIDSQTQFRISVFFISLLCPVFFFLNLKLKYKNINNSILLLISSLIMMSPYFRTSAFWGLHENYGILCILISYFFFQKYLIFNKNIKFKKFNLFLLTFFSSLCFYFDQKLIFIPLIFFLIIFFNNSTSKEIKILIVLFYIFFSLPALYLIFQWKGILPPSAQGRIHNIKLNIFNPGYAISIIFFYIMPFIFFLKNKKKKIKEFFKSKISLNIIIFIFYLLIIILFNDLFNVQFFGQGIFHKLINLILVNTNTKFIITIIIFFISWITIKFFLKNLKEKLIISFFFYYLIISSLFIYPIHQEYFDPLVLILIFLFCNLKTFIKFKNLIILFTYLSTFFICTNLYYLYFNKV